MDFTPDIQEGNKLHRQKIPAATILRLSVYHRYLKLLLKEGTTMISSAELAKRTNVNPAQLRKDLSYFGRFGVRGVGYDVAGLVNRVSSILGLERDWHLVLVGIGPIGKALIHHPQFPQQGYHFVAAIDIDGRCIGEEIGPGIGIWSLNSLGQVVKEKGVDLAVIAVAADRAQEVTDALVMSGIKGILNFSSSRLVVPSGVNVQYVDFTVLLDSLTYNISRSSFRTEEQWASVTDQPDKWTNEHSWPIIQSNHRTQPVETM